MLKTPKVIKMKKIAIIGLGVISKNYLKGLRNSEYFELVSVCDRDENAKARDFYSEYPFYTDYKKMIEVEKLDYVLIATPPLSHYQIAKDCLDLGVSVVIEKPIVVEKAHLSELVALAKRKGLVLYNLLHFQSASETVAFNKLYDPSKIQKIKVVIKDDYSDNGVSIKADRQGLYGVWFDSGSNSLSLIKTWLNFDTVEVGLIEKKLCTKTNYPIYIKANLKIDGVDVEIEVDWTKPINKKITYLTYDGEEMVLDSSNQSITYKGQTTCYDDMARLERHYYNFFTTYKGEENTDSAIKLLDALFVVNDQL